MEKFDKQHFITNVKRELRKRFSVKLEEATQDELYNAVSYSLMSIVLDNWWDTKKAYEAKESKQAFYLSAEFLMGRALGNNLVNLLLEHDVREALDEIGINLNQVEDTEPDAGLGNGGLGRLAACFLDSLATLQLPGHGYGIRYKYGMFEQKIENGFQVEYPDKWLKFGDPWAIRKPNEAMTVKFGGHVEIYRDEDGKEHFQRVNTEEILAIPYDYPIIGYGVKNVNTLRLWEAKSPDGFDLAKFNDQDYLRAMEKANAAEDISRVLYPNDSGPSGKKLRLKQQYFFVSASLQDIMKNYKKQYGNDFSKFSEKVALQLNDTHPVTAVPELMRILIDEEKLDWDYAWGIVTKTCAYTNHTLLAEALEQWPIYLFEELFPRIYQIVEEIHRRFLIVLRNEYPGEWDRHHKMAIISDGSIKMAWLAIVGSKSVNGVAALHTELLKNIELKEWDEMYPGKFNNKTNGVTQRRWLLKTNPRLADLLKEKIGDEWIVDLPQIKKFEDYIDDEEVVKRFMDIKAEGKKDLAEYIKEHNGIDVNLNSIFDVQIKRLHEYKRQLLNVLHIMYLYNKLKSNPDLDIYPRTFVFGAKAASGYKRAKDIIKLITKVGEVINNDDSINGKIKVVYLENYRVSVAERIFPASDVSEQISTAGKEASGTGNMKFMLNGAITLGTLDGANVEIVEEAGKENAVIFGLTAPEIAELNNTGGYNPWDVLNTNPGLKKVVDQLIDGTYNENGREIFREIYDSLIYGVDGNRPDQYYVLKDFEAYVKAQEEVDKAYRDKIGWAKKAMMNVANGGKFSSDRTINQYADEIWNIEPILVK